MSEVNAKPLSVSGYMDHLFFPKKTEKKKNAVPVAAGVAAGIGANYALNNSGILTAVHENGHKTAMELLYHYPPGQGPSISDYLAQNVQNFVSHPSADNFGKILSGYSPVPGVDGQAHWGNPDSLSQLGNTMGASGSQAVVDAAGCLATETLSLIEFAAGFKLRKEHPLLGYTLMTAGTLPYLSNLAYTMSALGSNPLPGNDWANFAQNSGLDPIVPVAAFAAALPLLGIALYAAEKHHKAAEIKDRAALGKLITEGKISSSQLREEFASYKGSGKIGRLESELQALLDKKDTKAALQKTAQLKREYDHFSDFLIHRHKSVVREEEKTLFPDSKLDPKALIQNVVNDIKNSYHQDKVGTALGLGSLGAVLTGSALRTAGAMVGGTAGQVIGGFVPFLGLIGTAAAVYRAVKVMQSPAATREDKAIAISLAVCSAMISAGLIIPGAGVPLALTGLAGIGATYAARHIADRAA